MRVCSIADPMEEDMVLRATVKVAKRRMYMALRKKECRGSFACTDELAGTCSSQKGGRAGM